MGNQNSTSQEESGFGLGVALGATLGAGAALLFGTKEGQKFKHELVQDFKDQIQIYRQTHPRESKKIKDAFEAAMAEARSTTDEIKRVAKRAEEKAKREADKRLFVKSGRPLKK